MKKYLPYIIAIFIPIMTFVIFFVMARNRSFIFSSSFSKEVRAELSGVDTKLTDKFSKHVYSSMIVLREKTEIKGAFFAKNTEGSAETLRRVSNTINAYSLGSDFVNKIEIVNNEREIIISSGRTETGQRLFEEALWNKLKVSNENRIYHIQHKGYYIFAVNVNSQGRIIFYVDVAKFKNLIPSNRNWLKQNLMFGKKAVFFACPSAALKQNLIEKINTEKRDFETPVEYKTSGYIIWGKRLVLNLRNNTVKTGILVFVIGNPKDFPLNFLQRLLLLINGVIAVSLILLMILKIKNQKEKERITEYKQRSNFVFDMLEESSKILDESARTGELSINEIYDVTEGLERDKGVSTMAITTEVEVASDMEIPEGDVSPEDQTVEIPDDAYLEYSTEAVDEELKELANQVSQGADLSNPSLKSYWANISEVLDIDFNISHFALLEEDEEGLFTVIRSQGLSPETVDNLKFSKYDKFYDRFFKLNKNLYIIKDAFVNKNLQDMFSAEDRQSIGELLLFPVTKQGDMVALLCFARERGLNQLEENALKDKIAQQSRI